MALLNSQAETDQLHLLNTKVSMTTNWIVSGIYWLVIRQYWFVCSKQFTPREASAVIRDQHIESRWGSMESILGFVYIIMHCSSLHAQMYTWSCRTLLNKPPFYILQQQILSASRSSQAIRNVYLWFWLVCSHGVSKWRNCTLLAVTEIKILIMNLTLSCCAFGICIYPCWYLQDILVLKSHLEELGRCRRDTVENWGRCLKNWGFLFLSYFFIAYFYQDCNNISSSIVKWKRNLRFSKNKTKMF